MLLVKAIPGAWHWQNTSQKRSQATQEQRMKSPILVTAKGPSGKYKCQSSKKTDKPLTKRYRHFTVTLSIGAHNQM